MTDAELATVEAEADGDCSTCVALVREVRAARAERDAEKAAGSASFRVLREIADFIDQRVNDVGSKTIAVAAAEHDASVRAAALEEAAKVLDRVPGFLCGVEGGRWLTEMAKDIRALAPAPPKGATR